SRAIAPASCTRALPCSSARSRSMPTAEIEMPTTTSNTMPTLMAASDHPSPALRGSHRNRARIWRRRSSMGSVALVSRAFDERFDGQGEHREHHEQRGDGERADEVVLVVEDLDVQGHRVREPPDVPRYHRHRTEFPHRASVAED